MTRILPDRFDSGCYGERFLIRHWPQLRENFLCIIWRVERLPWRFACAHSFPILPLGIGDLESRRIAQDETCHVERRRSSEDRPGVAHFREQRQSAGMIEMAVRE